MRTKKPDAPVYQRNWFKYRNQSTFEKYVKPQYLNAPCLYLEIGVFEGMCLRWMLENVLTHPESRAVGVDPWGQSDRQSAEWMEGACQRAHKNLEKWTAPAIERCSLYRMKSDDFFQHPILRSGLPPEFDLIQIDGDHHAPDVYRDTVNAWERLKVGGRLIWDDYENRIPKPDHVKHAVDRWLAENDGKWRHWYKDRFQVAVEKLA